MGRKISPWTLSRRGGSCSRVVIKFSANGESSSVVTQKFLTGHCSVNVNTEGAGCERGDVMGTKLQETRECRVKPRSEFMLRMHV